jgi:hypothetical protein
MAAVRTYKVREILAPINVAKGPKIAYRKKSQNNNYYGGNFYFRV